VDSSNCGDFPAFSRALASCEAHAVKDEVDRACDGGVAPKHLTPTWLTPALHSAGVLSSGKVSGVEATANPTCNSTLTHVALTSSADAPDVTPRRLVLKRILGSRVGGRGGVGCGRLLLDDGAVRRPVPMVAPCYHAAFDEVSRRSDLLCDPTVPPHRS
jgi:hypothetical protein